MSPRRRYLGSWTLPSGNATDVYLGDGSVTCDGNDPPSPTWPAEDVAHYKRVTFPEILRAVARVTGQTVRGVPLW